MNQPGKKNVPELCVLALLAKTDCYGYDISDVLSRRIALAEGTVYPILRKLRAEGLLTTYLSEESGGPPRKYYKITELGQSEFRKGREEYLAYARNVQEILLEEEA